MTVKRSFVSINALWSTFSILTKGHDLCQSSYRDNPVRARLGQQTWSGWGDAWIWKRFPSQFCIFQLILWNAETEGEAKQSARMLHRTRRMIVKQAQEVRQGSEPVRERATVRGLREWHIRLILTKYCAVYNVCAFNCSEMNEWVAR